MRLRISKKTRGKIPIAEDQAPLKTKENLEEYLQGAISFLQTQQIALERTISILEEISQLAPTIKEDVIRKVSKEQELNSRKKLKALRKELKILARLSFNKQALFSSEDADTSFPLFDGAEKILLILNSLPHLIITSPYKKPGTILIWNWFILPCRPFKRCLAKTTLPPKICKPVSKP